MYSPTLRQLTTAVICVFAAVAFLTGCAPQNKAGGQLQATIGIVCPAGAESPVRIAARELAAGLGKLYKGEVFRVFEQQAPGGTRIDIHLGTRASLAKLAGGLGDRLDAAESYVVTTAKVSDRKVGLIVGSDARGVMYGAHGLLGKLGCGYFLGVDAAPAPRTGPFSLDGWDLADRPLVPTRIVFNWHNFLSSCSTWNLTHWRQWTERSQKMGFNTIMVHAYGNNPMAGFRFRGLDKPVGYLASTRLGRSWFVNHANDVRRMHGGEVFDKPVFGSVAAVGGANFERTTAARLLMGKVFAHAERRGMNVIFAFDIDTPPGNPQELIALLDESDRFKSGGHWLPNPDTPGGYAFYKAQIAELLKAYPQIDMLALWHRSGGTPWMGYKHEEMPEAWRKEFDAACRETEGTDTLWHARHMFGMAKIAKACQKALREIDRKDVSVAFGSWHYGFLAGADRFMPRGVTLIPLDWMVLVDRSQLRDAASRTVIGKVAEHRPVLPVVWAHHDDGAYVMRPFKPFDKFQDRLDDARCTAHGYGIIHWTTRPLDLYFSSLSRQTWSRTRNEPFETTCRRAAGFWFGRAHRQTLGRYLQQWVDEAPMFARETSDWFVDRALAEPGPIAESMRRRISLLEESSAAAMTFDAKQRVEYFKSIEEFAFAIHRLEQIFRKVHKLIERGQLDEARMLTASIEGKPQRVIRRLAEAFKLSGITRGEQGLIVTLNTRWLPHYIRLRQRLGMAPIRYNFGPTVHDSIAPRPGKFTFHFDLDKRIWQTLGEKETGAKLFTLKRDLVMNSGGVDWPAGIGMIARRGLEIDKKLTIPLRPIMYGAYGGKGIKQSPNLPKGKYRFTTWTIAPAGGGEHPFAMTLTCGGATVGRFDEKARIAAKGRPALIRRDYKVTIAKPGEVKLTIEPVKGKVLLSGVVLEPAGQTD